jgi:hypothetical protein
VFTDRACGLVGPKDGDGCNILPRKCGFSMIALDALGVGMKTDRTEFSDRIRILTVYFVLNSDIHHI